MGEAPIGFQLHGLVAFGLFALWPFTRLVHVFSAPVGYLTRPYIVYRSRDEHIGGHRPRRGWEGRLRVRALRLPRHRADRRADGRALRTAGPAHTPYASR